MNKRGEVVDSPPNGLLTLFVFEKQCLLNCTPNFKIFLYIRLNFELSLSLKMFAILGMEPGGFMHIPSSFYLRQESPSPQVAHVRVKLAVLLAQAQIASNKGLSHQAGLVQWIPSWDKLSVVILLNPIFFISFLKTLLQNFHTNNIYVC